MHVHLARGAAALLALVQARAAPEVLPGDPSAALGEALKRSLARLDPAQAGWSAETRAAAVEAQLARLARFLESPGADPARELGDVFAPDFGARFAFRRLADVSVNEAFRVRRSGPGEVDTGGRDAFLRGLLEPLQGGRDVRAELELVGFEAEVGGLETQAALVLHAARPEGALQINGRWTCRWREDPDGAAPPRLASVEVREHEEVLARGGRLFTDCSASVFGATRAWAEELVPELAEWRARLDTRLDLPLLGDAAGIAVGDVDGDGLEDLYLCQPGGLPNKLFLHARDGTVRDASAEAGVDFLDRSGAALLLDLDGDGDRDLGVSAADRLLFLANDGRARFWLQAALDAPEATSLAAADVDVDGDLDLYACASASPYEHGMLPVPIHDARNGARSVFLENRGDWIFADVTAERGLEQSGRRFSSAAAFEDHDDDGDPDLYVANEFGRDCLYRNDGGTFVEVASAAGVDDPGAGMGVAWGDVDGDGRFDLFVSDGHSGVGERTAHQPNFRAGDGDEARALLLRRAGGSTVFRNDGGGRFSSATALGVRVGGRARGALFCDLDGDGWQDVLVPNGFLTGDLAPDLEGFFWREVVAHAPLDAAPTADVAEGYRTAWSALNLLLRRGHSLAGGERNRALLNLGGRGFASAAGACGFDLSDDARALALVDWDGDGDEDVFTTGRTSPRVRFLRNDRRASSAHVTLELAGTRANRDAIGARVELALADGHGVERRLVRAVRAGEGMLSQSSSRLTIGLGPAGIRIAETLVTWPGGERERFRGVEPGRPSRLVQGAGVAEPLELPRAKPLAASAPAARGAAPDAVRVPLVRPVPLPRLELTTADGNPLTLFGIQAGGAGQGTGKPVLLALFSTSSEACARELAELSAHAPELLDAGLAPLALSVEPPGERARAAAFLAERGWPFPWAVASPRALELLDALAAILRDRERRLELPASFLVDPAGGVRVLYLGPVGAAQLRADRSLCELGEGALLDAAVPFPGRWMFPAVPGDAGFFEGRLRARGLESAAGEFARARLTLVRTAPADLLQEFGRRCAVEGRLEEAEKFFRSALALDPRHFQALFDWAVVLHRQEELAEAAELYGKALALRPEHADARFNLALAQLGLGDREGAERQLRWLKARGAAGVEVLEQVLAGAGR